MSHRILQSHICRALLIAVIVGLATIMLFVQRFLTVTQPTGQGVLVVEAWIPDQSLKSAATAFSNGAYRYLVVIGHQEDSPDKSKCHFRMATDELIRAGAPRDRVVTITLPSQEVNRTRTTAQGFKKWLLNADPHLCCVDVYTVGVHARKSWITFRSVLGRDYRVGVIAGPESTYDPNYWIGSRRGIWLVFRNLAGYLRSKYEIAVGAVN